MGFQKTIISPSREVNPGTIIKRLNFSNKSYKELDINDGVKRPFYYFSEIYTTPPVYFYKIKDASVFLEMPNSSQREDIFSPSNNRATNSSRSSI